MVFDKTKIKDEIKNLLVGSRILSKQRKRQFMSVLNFLSETDLKELLVILETEQKGISEIENLEKDEERDFYRQSMAALENVYKKEYKKAISGEEGEEKNSAEELLKKLDL